MRITFSSDGTKDDTEFFIEFEKSMRGNNPIPIYLNGQCIQSLPVHWSSSYGGVLRKNEYTVELISLQKVSK